MAAINPNAYVIAIVVLSLAGMTAFVVIIIVNPGGEYRQDMLEIVAFLTPIISSLFALAIRDIHKLSTKQIDSIRRSETTRAYERGRKDFSDEMRASVEKRRRPREESTKSKSDPDEEDDA